MTPLERVERVAPGRVTREQLYVDAAASWWRRLWRAAAAAWRCSRLARRA